MKKEELTEIFSKRAETRNPQESSRNKLESVKKKIIPALAILVLPAIGLVAGNEVRQTIKEHHSNPTSITQQIDKEKTPETEIEPLSNSISITEQSDEDKTPETGIVNDESYVQLSEEENQKFKKEFDEQYEKIVTAAIEYEEIEKNPDTFTTEKEEQQKKLIEETKPTAEKFVELGKAVGKKGKEIGGKIKDSKAGEAIGDAGKAVGKAGMAIGETGINLGKAGVDKTADALKAGKDKLQGALGKLFGPKKKDNTEPNV